MNTRVVVARLRKLLTPHDIHFLEQGEAGEGSSLYLHLYADLYGDVDAPWDPKWTDEHWDRRAAEDEGWGSLGEIRISDHAQATGGGYSHARGERHGWTDWSIDPSTTFHPRYGSPMTYDERIEEVAEEVIEKLEEEQE